MPEIKCPFQDNSDFFGFCTVLKNLCRKDTDPDFKCAFYEYIKEMKCEK